MSRGLRNLAHGSEQLVTVYPNQKGHLLHIHGEWKLYNTLINRKNSKLQDLGGVKEDRVHNGGKEMVFGILAGWL